MKTFPELIKEIRTEAKLTQKDFAKKLEVSPVLIAMVETGQKEVSKRFILKLAEVLQVHPASITPFLYIDNSKRSISAIEKKLLDLGEKLQNDLIVNKSKLLRNE